MSNSKSVTCDEATSKWKRRPSEALGGQLSSRLPSSAADCTQDMQDRQDKKEIKEVNGIEEVQEDQAAYELAGDGQIVQELTGIKDHNGLNDAMDKAVAHCVIRSRCTRENNDPLFNLARQIKAIQQSHGVSFGPPLLRDVLERWKHANHGNLQSDFDYYTAFLEKLSQIKYATGEGLATALVAGRKNPVSNRAKGLPDKAQELARLCRELGKRNKGEFHLGCHAAAKVLGVAPHTALSYLRALSAVGIIKVVAPAVRPRWETQITPGGVKNVTQKGKATTYAYIADN